MDPIERAYERITTEIDRETRDMNEAQRAQLLRLLEEWCVNEQDR